MKKTIAIILTTFICILLFSFVSLAEDDNKPLPSEAMQGGVIYSNVYGEVLVSQDLDGTKNYTFFNTNWPSTKDLVMRLNAGENIDIEALLMGSATKIKDIYNTSGQRYPNMVGVGKEVKAGQYRGDYAVGSEYGETLTADQLQHLKGAVGTFLDTTPAASGGSEYDKIRAAHDFLINLASPTTSKKDHYDDAYGVLINKKGTSRGYTKAMKALCDAMGINCYYVYSGSGSKISNHRWVVCQINDNWHIVDVFSDDASHTYDYFLISDEKYKAAGMRWDENDTPKAVNYW